MDPHEIVEKTLDPKSQIHLENEVLDVRWQLCFYRVLLAIACGAIIWLLGR